MVYHKDDIVVGKVTGIAKYGIFLTFDDGAVGMVHISEMSYDFLKDIHEYVTIGEEIEVRVLDASDTSKLQLTMKGLSEIKVYNDPKHLKETRHGFDTLKEKLPIWVEEKLKNVKK